jgi:uncharacterized protein (DUF433 family)
VLLARRSNDELAQRITVDPTVLAGKPVIRGTRLSVELILDRLADGWTAQDVLQAYPRLTTGDLQAVFGFVAEMMKDEEYVAIGKVG